MTTTTEPDVHRADPDRINPAADAHARLDNLRRDHALPVPLAAKIEVDAHGVSYALTLADLPATDLEAWIAASGDPHPAGVLERHVWVGPVGWRVWVGHVAGLPATMWAVDPDARREDDPSPLLSLPTTSRVQLRPRPPREHDEGGGDQ